MARGDRGPGLGQSLPRLERPDHRRVLRAERRRETARRGPPHPRHHEQLRADQLQHRPDAVRVDGARRAGSVRAHPRRGPGEPRPMRRSRQRDRPSLQPHDHAARLTARPAHPGPLGRGGLSPPVRPGSRGHVAARDRGGHGHARGAGRGRHRVHDPRAAPGGPGAAAGRRRVDRRLGRARGSEAAVPVPAAERTHDRAVLLRRPDLALGRVRRPPEQRRGVRAPAAQGFADRPGAQLVHVATDGESYGHHHRFGEMALAAALEWWRSANWAA